MKTTSKLLTTSTIVLLMAGSAVAQSSGEFLDDEPSDSWRDDTDGSASDDPWDAPWNDSQSDEARNDPWNDSQSDETSNNSDAALPPMGEDVSLDQFEEFYDSLVREVDERLGQMEVTSDGEEKTLQGPDVSKNQSELDQIADSQREIRMLQLKLERAKLAKELWTELSAESIDELRARISQHDQVVEELEGQNASTQEELDLVNSDLADARAEIEELQTERDDALRSARQARMAASEALAAQSAAMAAGQPALRNAQTSGQSDPRTARSSARVQNIRLVGGRAQAEVSYPGNVIARVGVDDVLRDGSRAVSIDRTGVQVAKSGRTFSLDRGSHTPSSGEDGEDAAQTSGFTSPYSSGGGLDDFSGAGSGGGDLLEDAATDANP